MSAPTIVPPPSTDEAATTTVAPRRRAVPVNRRSALVLALASAAGLGMFLWPLLLSPVGVDVGSTPNAPLTFILILPVLVAIVVAELTDRTLDTRALALLGVLSAIGAGLRPLGAGTAGIETVFFLLILAGRVFGPGFGFVLGATTLFTSALVTAGVGPWLPYQMLAAAWVGGLAGILPGRTRLRGRGEIAMLVLFGVVAAFVYGFLMNLTFWPFSLGSNTELSFVAGAPVLENLHRFVVFSFGTSALGWDLGRALTNGVAIVLAGPAVLQALRRASRRARFEPAS